MRSLEDVSSSIVWVQVAAFLLGTIIILVASLYAAARGGAISNRLRFMALLAPYFILPISFTVSYVFYSFGFYTTSILSAFALFAVTTTASRLYLKFIPDPFSDNFGPRALPDPDHLILASEDIPPGFEEVDHRYSKQEYSLRLRAVENRYVYLTITESSVTYFAHSLSDPDREFNHLGIDGHVYIAHDDNSKRTTLHLIWLNPPKQRVGILLSFPSNISYSSEYIIAVLRSMRPATASLGQRAESSME